MNNDKGFAILYLNNGPELVTARVKNGEVTTIGINAKCGHEVLTMCVEQANYASELARCLGNLLRLEGARDDDDSELIQARKEANDVLVAFGAAS